MVYANVPLPFDAVAMVKAINYQRRWEVKKEK